jgi:hypothetical protein
VPLKSEIVRWPTVIASPRTDSIEDRAEKKWLDEKVEGGIVTLPKEIIQVFGLIEQSDEVNEEGI